MSDGRTPLGAQIRRLRKEMGLTQSELAVRMGLSPKSQTQVSEWETGKVIPQYDTCRRIERIAREEGLDVDEGTLTRLAAVQESGESYGHEGHEPLRPADLGRWPPVPDPEGSLAEQWMWEFTEGSQHVRRYVGYVGWRSIFQGGYDTALGEGWPHAELKKMDYFRDQFVEGDDN